jgi:hypothetical protein
MKHVGKMKNNGAKIVIAYRTIPGDPYSALVIGTQQLQDSYHDALIQLIESPSGQQVDELADVMAARRFPDGSNMLAEVHRRGWMTKVPTAGVIITPDNKTSIPLDELNVIIAQQKGVRLEDLSIKDGANSTIATLGKPEAAPSKEDSTSPKIPEFSLTPVEMRSRADALYKEAAKLREAANELDPPKRTRTTKSKEVAE